MPTDATQRRLLEQLELNARILEAMPGGIVHVGADGSIQTANAEALRILGMSFDQATQRYTNDWDPVTLFEDGRPCPVEEYPVTLALMTGAPQPPMTIGIQRPDGHLSWAVFTAIPVLDPEAGSVAGAVVTFVDITSQKAAAERERELLRKALEAQKLESLGLLAGGMAHDFNNLLSAILGNLELALREPLPERVQKRLERAVDTADRAAAVVAQILAFSGGGTPHALAVDLAAAIADLRPLLDVSVHKKSQLRFTLEPHPVWVDPVQLQQVLLNLVVNANESLSGVPGTIEVRSGFGWFSAEQLRDTHVDDGLLPGTYGWIEVEDDGTGMAPEHVARVTDPFFSNKGIGRGLGLASVLGIVRTHHGAIDIDSTPGVGTRVRVLLPSAEARRDPDTPRDPTQPLALVIDDEQALREILVETLEDEGFAVLQAPDGKSGLERALRHRDELAVVVSDVTMPALSGIELVGQLREAGVDVPVLLVSGFVEPGTQPPTGERTAFLAKPFRPSALVEQVRALIG